MSNEEDNSTSEETPKTEHPGYIHDKYVIETETRDQEKPHWNTLEVKIYQVENGEKKEIGSFQRNYHCLFGTFFPFAKDGKEYALYSREYMYTRVMELPSCRDLGGEDNSNVDYKEHFCPTDLYVPIYRKVVCPGLDKDDKMEMWLKGNECFDEEWQKDASELHPVQYCDFGFVAGCFWGDDSSWKIQFLDLSEVEKGIIRRDERLGYLEMPEEMELKEAISMENWEPGHNWVGINNTIWRDFETAGKAIDEEDMFTDSQWYCLARELELPKRQLQTARGLFNGKGNEEIAQELGATVLDVAWENSYAKKC